MTTDTATSGAALEKHLCLTMTAANICHPSKKAFFGEDAFGFRADGHHQALAVADGVSGSRSFGDPAEFSRSLLDCLLKNSKLYEDPISAISEAISEVRSAGKKGSTTVIFGTIDCDQLHPILHLYNIGDSKTLLFRSRKSSGFYNLRFETLVQYRVTEYEYSNMPYQLHNNAEKSCSISDIETYHWPLQKGDIIVMASDGLTDFLDEQDIEASIEACRNDFQSLASTLANQARKEQDYYGRYDDISIIVANVEEVDDLSNIQLMTLNNFESPPPS